jgi:hypothetical protein
LREERPFDPRRDLLADVWIRNDVGTERLRMHACVQEVELLRLHDHEVEASERVVDDEILEVEHRDFVAVSRRTRLEYGGEAGSALGQERDAHASR